MVFIGMIGMLVISHYQYERFITLKENHFWLYHRYYLRVAEAGILGLVSLLVVIFELRRSHLDTLIISAICVTCFFKLLFGWLAAESYLKLRQGRKTYWREAPQPQAEKPQTEDPYVQMMLGFATLPGWHNLLSTLLIFLITTGFITIPLALISNTEDNNPNNGDTNLFKKISKREPLYVHFTFFFSFYFRC